MAETQDIAVAQRDRSPAFPSIPLEAALKRLAEFEAHFKRSAARPQSMGDAWGIKAAAYASRVAAALRYFGLLDYQGVGKDRRVVVSEEGRKYLRAQQEETRREVIKGAALRPKQIAEFWAEWGADRPADAACLDELTLKKGFSDAGAREFLKVYDETISFAGLSDSDKISQIGEPAEDKEMEVRPEPTRKPIPPRPDTERAEFPLPEGVVRLEFPASLSTASYEDFEAWMELVLRRAKRSIQDTNAREQAEKSIPNWGDQ
jgi:hypothetical protein